MTVRAAVVLLVVLGLAGCGTLDGAAVAEEAADALADQVGARPDVTCPEDLEEEVGAGTRCSATVEGATFGVTVTVRALDDEGADLDVLVDRQPQG